MKGPAPPPQLQLAQLAREHGVPGCRVQGAGCRVQGAGLQPGAGAAAWVQGLQRTAWRAPRAAAGRTYS